MDYVLGSLLATTGVTMVGALTLLARIAYKEFVSKGVMTRLVDELSIEDRRQFVREVRTIQESGLYYLDMDEAVIAVEKQWKRDGLWDKKRLAHLRNPNPRSDNDRA
jgi:hypothetical protein